MIKPSSNSLARTKIFTAPLRQCNVFGQVAYAPPQVRAAYPQVGAAPDTRGRGPIGQCAGVATPSCAAQHGKGKQSRCSAATRQALIAERPRSPDRPTHRDWAAPRTPNGRGPRIAQEARVTITTILAVVGGIVIVLDALARIPSAVARLINAFLPLIAATRSLRSALTRPKTGDVGKPTDHTLAESASPSDGKSTSTDDG